MLVELAAGICLLGAIAFAGLWARERGRLRLARLHGESATRNNSCLDSVLAIAPAAAFCWSSPGHGEAPFGRLPDATHQPADYSAFLALLDTADAERVRRAVDDLRQGGTGFTAMVSATNGAVFQIEGSRTANNDSVVWLIDSSALRRAEQAHAAAVLQADAAQAIIDALPVPVWRRDGDMRIVACNEAYAALLDQSRDAVLSAARETQPGGSVDLTLSRAREACAGSAGCERRHVVVAGSRRLLELCEIPGAGGGTVGYAIDHTDVETAQSELRRHMNAHGQVLESIHAAVAIYGADKRLSFFNAAFATLWGLETDWLAGRPSLDELLERLRERRRVPEFADFRAFKRQQLAMFTSLIQTQTELMHLPDGRTLSFSMSPHPLGGLIFVYEDVTDRLALESSYNTLIEVQRETLDNLFEGIAVFGSDGRLKLHNPAYRQMWGLSESDVGGEPRFGDIVEKTRHYYDEGDDWPALRQQVTARITSQAPWTGQIDRQDGSVLRLGTVPLPDGNMLFTGLDVTDSARVERALRESNDALETAGRLKSEFIANVSYELRTPLNAIIGFAEILANQYFGPLSARQLDYSRGILASSHRLMSLINDILDLATIEAGYMALESAEIDLQELLEGVMSFTRERARSQDLTLTVSCPPDIGTIEADERRLKQALFNLISNAMKFTPAGKSISLDAHAEEDGDIVLSVVDTGIGIAAADQERIFEKFERGKPNSREAGAGLGLSLVKSLIELHGGSVAIQSEPGEGTTISCRLPAHLRLPAEEPALTS